jgi:hypothetical protein
VSRTLTAACSLSWIDDAGETQSATIGDTVTVPDQLVHDLPHAFRESGGAWSVPPLDLVDDLDKLRANIVALVFEGGTELGLVLAEIDAAIEARDTPPPPVDPDTVPLTITPEQLRAAGVTAKVLAKVLAEVGDN